MTVSDTQYPLDNFENQGESDLCVVEGSGVLSLDGDAGPAYLGVDHELRDAETGELKPDKIAVHIALPDSSKAIATIVVDRKDWQVLTEREE